MKNAYQYFLERCSPDEMTFDERTDEEKKRDYIEEMEIYAERTRQIMLEESMMNVVFDCPICKESVICSSSPYANVFCSRGHNVFMEPISTICLWCNSYFGEDDSCIHNDYLTQKGALPFLGCFRFKWAENVSQETRDKIMTEIEEIESFLNGESND